eukprot:CAMPEP_0206193696 /NCGR_PEP_ID=MMETSP0166-20121206/6728_1 /ASSEMBLY_ACC=CAM_ASM_000260 /TAXON_ID=95228 /ORGANISM="Vannella robusta, Strain DIVA3 518/3/11/1/6" /LENGTH=244 /DNA_ID=CAMNT_0053610473 /DNA_START=384 /DNA_END=1115 /DNA_ORIENTATION=+
MDTKTYGRMLCLDGIIQLTERDEFSYQEMLAFVSLCSHSNPKTVCVIGGGDGAILSRLVMHPGIEKIFLCELDIGVINAAKEYFPQFNRGFDDPRVTVITSDGAKFLADHENFFDVVITDSSDPIGPADSLFSVGYFKIVHKALTDNGISVSQGECMWLHLDLISKLAGKCKETFNHVEYGSISIPTYPCGQIGMLVCSKGQSPKKPLVRVDEILSKEDLDSLRYYTTELHSGCFVLPKFIASV